MIQQEYARKLSRLMEIGLLPRGLHLSLGAFMSRVRD